MEFIICNVKKYEKRYRENEKLEPVDTLRLMLETDAEE